VYEYFWDYDFEDAWEYAILRLVGRGTVETSGVSILRLLGSIIEEEGHAGKALGNLGRINLKAIFKCNIAQ
jgi:hypothetical protein